METVIPLKRVVPQPKARRNRGGALAFLSQAAPPLAERLFLRWYFQAPRFRAPGEWQAQLQFAEVASAKVSETSQIVTYAWGRFGAPILLVHGWAGSAAQMAPMAVALSAGGQRVLAFDLPAHGQSNGETTNAIEIADVLMKVAAEHGPFAGVVGHSLGAGAVVDALGRGLHADKVALISPVVRYTPLPFAFADRLGFDKRIAERALIRLQERFGDEVLRPIDQPQVQAALRAAQTLLVHDLDDRESPFAASREIAALVPNAKLVATAGLGHVKLLAEQPVHDELCRFFGRASLDHL